MNWDHHPADATFFADPPELPPPPTQCCDDCTPGEHEGQRYCQSCDADLCELCDRRVELGYDGKHCSKHWEEGVVSRG